MMKYFVTTVDSGESPTLVAAFGDRARKINSWNIKNGVFTVWETDEDMFTLAGLLPPSGQVYKAPFGRDTTPWSTEPTQVPVPVPVPESGVPWVPLGVLGLLVFGAYLFGKHRK